MTQAAGSNTPQQTGPDLLRSNLITTTTTCMKYITSWQGKTLAIIGLMTFGMMVRDAVAYLFSSLWNLLVSDWTAVASLTIILFVVMLIMSVAGKLGHSKGNNNGNPNYQNHQHRGN